MRRNYRCKYGLICVTLLSVIMLAAGCCRSSITMRDVTGDGHKELLYCVSNEKYSVEYILIGRTVRLFLRTILKMTMLCWS